MPLNERVVWKLLCQSQCSCSYMRLEAKFLSRSCNLHSIYAILATFRQVGYDNKAARFPQRLGLIRRQAVHIRQSDVILMRLSG